MRTWAWIYTFGLPLDVAARRRAEIESDLWESQHDPDASHRRSPALIVSTRLLLGLYHDLLWRVEQIVVPREFTFHRIARVAATAAFLLAGLWVVPLWSGNKPHEHCITPQQADIIRMNPAAGRALLLGHRDESSSMKVCRP